MATPPMRPWAELQHDLLVSIMSRVGAPDLLFGRAPLACSSWRAAARDPVAWRRIDLRDWATIITGRRATGLGTLISRLSVHAELAGILEVAATRAGGRIEAVLLPEFADEEHLLFLADSCPNLHYFSLPSTCVTYDQFCKAIGGFHSLKGMAVDESLINYDVLLHVQQCCPEFVELKVSALYVDEEMACVICLTLPHLKKLEIPNSDISSSAIIKFLERLEELEYMDISGYEISAISSTVLEKASRLQVFLWNSKFELGEFTDCSNCGEHNLNPLELCECMMEHKVMDWLAGSSQTS